MAKMTNDDNRRISATSSSNELLRVLKAAEIDYFNNSKSVYSHSFTTELLERECVATSIALELIIKLYERAMSKASDQRLGIMVGSPTLQANLKTVVADLLAFNAEVEKKGSEFDKLTDYINDVLGSVYTLNEGLYSMVAALTGESEEKCSCKIKRKSKRIIAPSFQLM
jgi:hypothetical protein